MNKNIIFKIVIFVLLAVMLGTFTHCISNAPVSGGGSSGSHSNSVLTPPTPEEEINQAQVAVGIKDREQLLNSYSVLTGISTMNTNVQGVYSQVEATLPTDNQVKVFLASNQVAVMRLAAEFCTLVVDNDAINAVPTNRATIWPGFNFNLTLNSFDTAQRQAIIDGMISAFWGDGMLTQEELAQAEDEFLTLMQDLTAAEPNTAASTRKVIKGACTAALASAYVILI